MSSSVLTPTLTTSSVWPYSTWMGLGWRPTGAPPCQNETPEPIYDQTVCGRRATNVLAWALTCCRTCHTMQVVSLEPEIRWIPQWSVDRQVTMSAHNTRRSLGDIPARTNPIRFWKKILTHVPDVLRHRPAFDQRRHPNAVVPVSAAEEQLPIVGDDKQPRCYLHARSKGSRQETLGSYGQTKTETALGSAVSQNTARHLWIFGLVKSSCKEMKQQQEGTKHFCVDRFVFSLGVGHCGVFNEGEVVGDALVVRQPPVSPNQAVLTHRHLET